MIDFAEFIARSAELSAQLPAPHKVTEHQTEGLYLRVYEPEQPCTQLLVVYHGAAQARLAMKCSRGNTRSAGKPPFA